jgi:hypothetical protein
MSDDELKQFNEQLAEGARLQADSNRMQAMQLEVLTKLAQAQGINIDSINKSKNAFEGLRGSTSKQSAAAESTAHSLKVMDDAMANFNKAANSAGLGLNSFAKALLSNEQGFAKYNDTLKNAGDAVGSLLKNFGPLGQAASYAVKGLTMAAEMATKQADGALKATDELSKLGGAGSLTAEQVLRMGHGAGLTSANLEVMTKAAGKVNSGMAILGSTVGEGMVAFGKMTAVTSEQRQAFQRLGVSQEELMNRQADYIKQQEMSGMSLSKDQAKVKKESLEYAEQLSRLSILTGKSADKIQAEQDAVQLEYEEVLAQQVTKRKIAKLEDEGGKENLAAAAKLREDEKKRIDFQKTVTATFGKETGLQAARVARTGQIDEKTKGLVMRGITVDDVQAGAKKGEVGGAEFNEKLKEGTGNLIDTIGDAIGRSSNAEQLGRSVGLDQESVQKTGNLSGRKETEALANATALTKGASSENKEENKAAGGAAATDPAQIARNELTEAEIKAKVKLDELILEFNPLMKGFNSTTLAAGALMIAATAAALALGKMAASAAMNKTGGGPDVPDKTKGKGKGTLGKVASGAGRLVGPAAGVLAVGMGAMTAYQGAKDVDEKVKSGELTKDEGTVKKSEAVGKGVGQAAVGAAGAWGGAAAGAAIGSVVPVVGTIIGGLLGAAVGGWLGSKGGEIVGENVGKSVGKSMVEKPVVDASGRATAATDPRLAGPTQPTTTQPTTTQPTNAVKLSDIQANMAKGMSQKDAQKAAEENLAKMSATTAGATKTAATDPRVGNAIMKEEQESMSKGLSNMVREDQERAKQAKEDMMKLASGTGKSDKTQDPMLLLSKSLGLNTAALEKLTGSITNLTKPTQTGTATGGMNLGMTKEMTNSSKAAGGGISVPGGVPASFKSSGGGGAGAVGGGSAGDMPTKSSKPTSQPPEEGGPGSATKTVDLAKIMKFGTNSGTQQNFEALDSSFKDAVTAAAKDYNATTGNKLQINSAKRDPADQQRIWDESVAAGREGKTASGMPIGKPGRSLHEKGQAIDIQNYKDPDAIAAMNKQGLTQKVPNDPVHFQAELGGIMNGAKSGYPVEGTMHGREAIIPLNPDSIITKLLDTSESQLKQEINNNTSTTTTSDNTSQIMADLYTMMSEKFDAMIGALEDGNDHTEKLVKFSAV